MTHLFAKEPRLNQNQFNLGLKFPLTTMKVRNTTRNLYLFMQERITFKGSFFL